MTANPPPTQVEASTFRTHHEQAEVDRLLTASFTAANYRTCNCGRVLETADAVCHPCRYNGRLGPLYGGSLAGSSVAACSQCTVLRGQLAEAQAAAVRASKRGGAE